MHFKPWHARGGFDRRVIAESKYDGSGGQDDYRRMLIEKGLLGKQVGHHTPGFGAAFKAMVSSELPPEDHIDAFIGRRGAETLQVLAESGRPFFLAVSFCGPHDPYDPPPAYASLYRHEDLPLGHAREGELDVLPESVYRGVVDMGKEHLDLTAVPSEQRRRIAACYYGNISLIDAWVGRLIGALKEARLYEDTIILFTSDHGEYLGDHNLCYKGFFPCDSDCGVPLILKAPGVEAGTTCDALTGNVAVMPTLLDAAGLSIPSSVQGRSLLPVLHGTRPGDDAVVTYSEAGPAWRLRTRDWAYVFRGDAVHDQLYRLADDPHELTNLAQDPAAAGELDRMKRMLLRKTWEAT
jgi:arylsulfatase A-like enzyme